jgi:putative methyltransferase
MIKRVRRNVLISEPHALENPAPFLPYVWAILKSHWERHGDVDAYHWLPPIFLNLDPDSLLEPYRDTAIDVLGLSCYTWNFRLQCALAERVKRANPGCLVVAGGPEPDYKDPEFFNKYPYIDAIAVKDGEITFARILTKFIDGDSDFADVGGLYLPAPAHARLVGGRLPAVDQGSHLCTGPAEVPKEFDYSPYLDQRAYYDTLREQYGRGFFSATWETNRGCPYSCSFCDWGSATMSKLRRFSMERVAADVDWLASMGASFVMLADANLGILERDLEIADLLCAARARHGFPRMLYYSAAKNNPDRSVEIARKFAGAQLCSTHTLAIQHTRPEVLEASDRANISPARQIAVARALMESDIPIDVQLILGIPGDTYDLWKSAMGDLMEWGIHEAYDTYFYSLLPNAPAAEPAFLREWEVATIDRIILADTAQPWKAGDLDRVRMTTSRIIVKTKTFSREDWVRMFTYVSHVKALHNGSITRLLATYLRLTHGVPYRVFYEDLIERFAATVEPVRAWHDAVASCYRTMLRDDDAMDRIPVGELPNYPCALDPSRWLFVHACFDLDAFFFALKTYLLDRYPQAENLSSLIDYQKEMIILPDYDRRAGKRFRSDFDWLTYFERTRGRTGDDSLPEPDPTPGALVEVADQTCGERGYLVQPLAWESKSGESRRIEWINRTVLHRASARKQNFQRLSLTLAGAIRPVRETASVLR